MSWDQILTPAILVLLTAVVFPLLRTWIAKIQNDRLRDIGASAVGWAEQQARNNLMDSGRATPGADKKVDAVGYAMELAAAAKIKVDRSKMEDIIEEAVGAYNMISGKK